MELTIHSLAYGGDGIGRSPEGMAVFVPYTAPGDLVRVEVTQQKQRYARGRASEHVQVADCRAEPFCPHYGTCQGCQLQHVDQPTQLHWKGEFVRDALTRIGKLDQPTVVPPPAPLHDRGYRSHAAFAVELVDRQLKLGFHGEDGAVVDLDACPLVMPLVNHVVASARAWLSEHADELVDEEGTPWLRWIDIRANATEDQSTVALWCGSRRPQGIGQLAAFLQSVEPSLAGVCSVRSRGRKRQSGGRAVEVAGVAVVTERVGRRRLRVSAQSFYQANPEEAARLRQAAVELAGESQPRTAIELYAGVGFFTVALAEHARRVVAIEGSSPGARDLRRNMRDNHLGRVQVRRGDALNEVEKLRAKGVAGPIEVWLNPPRGGAGEKVAAALCQLAADEIVYVSCDPTTLSRDARKLAEGGYHLAEARTFDLFPQTYHVETVALFRRQ